jgi:hypothetical protein
MKILKLQIHFVLGKLNKMIFRQLLIEELNSRREDFRRFALQERDEFESYLALLAELSQKKSAEVRDKLNGKTDVGALPSDEMDARKSIAVKFEPRWQNHEQARKWATEILQNRTTFAADGSQIQPGREINLPVAAVQIGTFENAHNERGEYRKQAFLKIIAPNEFFDSDLLEEKPIRAETLVGFLRFEAEIKYLKDFLREKSGWRERGERMPLAFLDNTLLLSIALPQTKLQNRYIAETAELVRVSEAAEVPIIGYVDQSYARDLIHLLDSFSSFSENRIHEPSDRLSDAQLLTAKTLESWGDRTIYFDSRREHLSDFFTDKNGDSTVGFVYLKTASDAVPARLDVPAWIYKQNLLDEVLNTVRAECVIGLGYPYALETADATAVISSRDRELFLRALQDFSVRENLNFRVASKRMSKARRR